MELNNEIEVFVAATTPEEQKRELFGRQKELLDTFLAHGAISRDQYETSLQGLKAKMEITV